MGYLIILQMKFFALLATAAAISSRVSIQGEAGTCNWTSGVLSTTDKEGKTTTKANTCCKGSATNDCSDDKKAAGYQAGCKACTKKKDEKKKSLGKTCVNADGAEATTACTANSDCCSDECSNSACT